MAAKLESTLRSPTPNRKNGTTLPTVAATAKCSHTTGSCGIRRPRIRQITTSRPAASSNRRNTSCIGVKPRSPILIHAKLDPQSTASSTRRTTLLRRAVNLPIYPAWPNCLRPDNPLLTWRDSHSAVVAGVQSGAEAGPAEP